MSRECPVCHHSMTHALVRHVQTWHDRVVVFDNVPAEVCSQCGETLLLGRLWTSSTAFSGPWHPPHGLSWHPCMTFRSHE